VANFTHPQVVLPTVVDSSVDLETFVNRHDAPTSLSEAFGRAKRALAAATGIDEVKGIRDQAETLRSHAKRVKWSLEIQNQIAEIKLRAERKAGQILATLTVKGGVRHKLHDESYERHSVLADLNITQIQSFRWQGIATIPDEKFENFVKTAYATQKELTTASALRLATRLTKNESNLDDGAEDSTSKNIEKCLASLARHIEKAKQDDWRVVSRDAVITRLEDLIENCRAT